MHATATGEAFVTKEKERLTGIAGLNPGSNRWNSQSNFTKHSLAIDVVESIPKIQKGPALISREVRR